MKEGRQYRLHKKNFWQKFVVFSPETLSNCQSPKKIYNVIFLKSNIVFKMFLRTHKM